jgi:hypothetical protein
MKKQATAKEHVEIVLKLSVRCFLPSTLDVAVVEANSLSLRFGLAMVNIL